MVVLCVHLSDYVDISPLDPWHTSVLRHAQKTILGEEDQKQKSKSKPKPSASSTGAHAGGASANHAPPPANGGQMGADAGEVVPAVPTAGDDEETDEDNDPFA